jgi:hypothetical protein
MQKKLKICCGTLVLIPVILIGLSNILALFPENRLYCQVWSENSPYGQRTEFKVNWDIRNDKVNNYEDLIDCWLFEMDDVKVTAPDGSVHTLNKDFNINNYSGEVTQRWVLYGAAGLTLPPSGNYIFQFFQGGDIVVEKTVKYTQSSIEYPTNVRASRQGTDLLVNWDAPANVNRQMWYKIIISNYWDTPALFISESFNWNANSGIMPNVPFIEGGNYTLNVALYFDEGYAFSQYYNFTWSSTIKVF